MRRSRTLGWGVWLVVLSVLLWVPPVLFFLRMSPAVVTRVLLKAPGLYLVYAALVLGPAGCMVLGWRLWRGGGRRGAGQMILLAGMVLTAAFVVVVGVPLTKRAMAEKTPINPKVPRAIEPLAGLEAFPGAEGFGTRTRRGRGGKVIEVTTLEDSGPGSLRAALEDPEPRTVVFRVGGTIDLKKKLVIAKPFVTVAGQSAPGGGVCVRNAGLTIATHDVVVRYVRIRPGDEGEGVDPDDNDAVQIFGAQGKSGGAWNVVLDHVSASWSEDEAVSTWFGAHDVTICNCIISEALNRGRHHKRTHSAGLLIGDGSYHVSVHHNLLAHNSFRNPLVSKGGTHDFVNNVFYDWCDIPGEVYDLNSNSFLNFVGNYYKPGPSSERARYDITINLQGGTPKVYVEGNIGIKRSTADMDEWASVSQMWGGQAAPQKYRSLERFPTPPVKTWPAAEAMEKVLADAGARLPRRDAVDDRMVAEVRAGTGRVIDSPREVGGYPMLESGTAEQDSDHDGMPDAWEKERGLNPLDASDAGKDRDGDGYANLEEYLNGLVISGNKRS